MITTTAKLAYLDNLPEVSLSVTKYLHAERELLDRIAKLETELADVRARGNALAKASWSKAEIDAAKARAADPTV